MELNISFETDSSALSAILYQQKILCKRWSLRTAFWNPEKNSRANPQIQSITWSITCTPLRKNVLVHGSHLEQRIFAGTKWLGGYQVQASRFIAQVIVLVIINAMISNDCKFGIMEESKKSQHKYCLIVKK